jgi:hypothetical protein
MSATLQAFDVYVRYPEPLIGGETVRVQAHNQAHATLLVRAMRAEKNWPRGSTYLPRMVDRSTYRCNLVDGVLA